MKCKVVSRHLSSYLDESIERDKLAQISQHLSDCRSCREEFERLARLRATLRSLDKVPTPLYLRHLVQLRLAGEEHNNWRTSLREAIEYRWSRIRTTDGIWYVTRLLGTLATFVLFFSIVAAVRPMYMDPSADRGAASQALRQQLPLNVLKNLGLTPLEAQKKPISPSDPQINDLYLLNFGETASRMGKNDDTFAVVAVVDRSGAAKIQDVLEWPADSALLSDFNAMIRTARCRPASQNGRAVDSHLVMTFSKISVYD